MNRNMTTEEVIEYLATDSANKNLMEQPTKADSPREETLRSSDGAAPLEAALRHADEMICAHAKTENWDALDRWVIRSMGLEKALKTERSRGATAGTEGPDESKPS